VPGYKATIERGDNCKTVFEPVFQAGRGRPRIVPAPVSGANLHHARASSRSTTNCSYEAMTQPDPNARAMALRNRTSAPGGRAAHPRAEHLAPLFVAVGAAGTDVGRRSYQDKIFGKAV
jgi:aromatic ring-opening dioxygenase catalytic subunit (LigB family)